MFCGQTWKSGKEVVQVLTVPPFAFGNIIEGFSEPDDNTAIGGQIARKRTTSFLHLIILFVGSFPMLLGSVNYTHLRLTKAAVADLRGKDGMNDLAKLVDSFLASG